MRLGPGKGVAFGKWQNVPVFCLPGGPTSNRMAFLRLALPALLRMEGDFRHPLQTVPARLAENVQGRHRAWTEFKDATITLESDGFYQASLYNNKSRLQSLAGANGLICIPEGTDRLPSGEVVPVQLIWPHLNARTPAQP